MSITDSQRFSTKIADAIQNIRLDNSLDLKGNVTKQILKNDGTQEEIKPYIILFEDSQIQDVITKFKDLILEHKLHIPETTRLKPEKIKFKAIGWVGQDKDEETKDGQKKHVLKDYFEANTYRKDSRTKETFDNLADYLLKHELSKNESRAAQPQTSKVYKDAITNSFLKVLRTVGKKQDDGKYYIATSFWQKVNSDKAFADMLLFKIISWTKSIVQGNSIIEDVRAFTCNELEKFFDYKCNQELITFLNNPPKLQAINNQKPKNYLEYEYDNIKFKIDIATIHSVKGETHTGTLYLETSYYGYETNKVSGRSSDNTVLQLLKKNNRNELLKSRITETLKMAYVGMSRPTHLLCLAIHKSSLPSFEKCKQELEAAGWEVINLE